MAENQFILRCVSPDGIGILAAVTSFKGAQPYHQAHKRGVKLIGAYLSNGCRTVVFR